MMMALISIFAENLRLLNSHIEDDTEALDFLDFGKELKY